ncbi:MAG: CheR family methyltransferase [Bacilli bacterium]
MNDYTYFIERIKRKTGIDLGAYKEAQMKRRLTTLYEKHGYTDFRSYADSLERDKEAMSEFLDRMTINVSEFYRNRKRWDVVEARVFPELLKQNSNLKIWSAACSTGEEPYTLALILNKYVPFTRMKIEATDLDLNVMARARMGVYPERSLLEMPAEVKAKHFQVSGGMYTIHDEVKRAVSFRQHNLLNDQYGSGYDLIVCRNVMIYFTEEAKSDIYHKFARALRPGGILFVGSTEQIFNYAQYGFEQYDTFFYRKKA